MPTMQRTQIGRAPPGPQRAERSVVSELLCGSFGGLCAALATHPLDTIKTRMQSGGAAMSVGQVCRSVLTKDGWMGFYRGISVPAISQPLYVGSSFAGLQAGYYLWDGYRPMGTAGDSRIEPMLRLVFSGGIGGAACAFAVTPGERVKVVLQMQGQGGKKTQTPLQTIRTLVAAGGYRSLYVGLQATILREVPGTILWFGAFESVSSHAEAQWALPRPVAVLCGAVAAGLTFWLPIIPIDTVKVKQQTANSQASNGAMEIAKQIMKTRGLRGFWAGSSTILARGILLDVFQFSGAERLRNMQQSKKSLGSERCEQCG